ncbi:GNAT family protein [Pengzhenrongella sp.]|uniref:GNAT family N-acetyltransferase n=1 Tax=Pengzhenrongella sp. TaxID=2888820 RepID=UPI002F9374DF
MTELLFPTPPLTDGVVLLRPWRATNLPAKVRAFGDPQLQRFSWTRAQPATAADIEASLRTDEEARAGGQALNFAVVEPRDEDVVLGGAALYDVTLDQGRAGVGYWLAPEARGRGAATRAVRLLTRWAFSTLALARIELTCGPDNAASQRVAERSGFTREGILRSHLAFQGGRRDTVLFSLLPRDH